MLHYMLRIFEIHLLKTSLESILLWCHCVWLKITTIAYKQPKRVHIGIVTQFVVPWGAWPSGEPRTGFNWFQPLLECRLKVYYVHVFLQCACTRNAISQMTGSDYIQVSICGWNSLQCDTVHCLAWLESIKRHVIIMAYGVEVKYIQLR